MKIRLEEETQYGAATALVGLRQLQTWGALKCSTAVDGSRARRFDVKKARGRIATENWKLPKPYVWRINQVNFVYQYICYNLRILLKNFN